MSNQREPATWQEFLGPLIANSHERQRLATKIRVRPVTLQRWAEKVSVPRPENIRALLKHLPPRTYPLFMRLLIADFPELLREELVEERLFQELPSEFYARVLSNLAQTPQPMYRQSVQDLILQQMLEHLDPEQQGLAISLAACVLPRTGGKVHSLRETGGLGTPPWPRHLAEKRIFLGAESLAGYAITHGRPYALESREEMTFFPAHWTENERSAAAFPLWRQARIAGALIVSSTQEYFFTQPRLAIIEGYAHLASCIFEPEECFAHEEIELRMMPSDELQVPYFSGYNQRISQKFAEAAERGQRVTLQQVRECVWQDLEEVLFQVFLQTEGMSQIQH